MKFRNIFITVGTTEFNDLIRKIAEPEIYEIFKNHFGCKNLKIQLGNGENISFDDFLGIDVEVFTLKDSIADDIEAADLVMIDKMIDIMSAVSLQDHFFIATDHKSRWSWDVHRCPQPRKATNCCDK